MKNFLCGKKMSISSHCSVCGSTFRETGDFMNFQSTNGKVQNDNRSLTPNENDLDVPTVTHERLE
jgi:hypothetical protein